MDDVAFFDKSPYESPPSLIIQQMIAKLAPLGKAVIAARNEEMGWSANILRSVSLGDDGGDPVLGGKPAPPGECTCHIHVKWNQVCGYALEQEDVGYGPEAVIYLLNEHGESIIRIFYPEKTYAEVEAALASEGVSAKPTSMPFRYVFMIQFESEENMEAYMEFWHEISPLIQQEAGALGTRLHRVRGGFAVLAIAEWESKQARILAYQEIAKKYPPDHKIHWQANRFWGKHAFIVEADEIGMALP